MTEALDVVTGGAGFIGSHLSETLLNRGRRVRVVDNFATGRRAILPRGVELVEGDVNDVAGDAFRGAATVYHLAALPSVPRSVKQPLQSHHATARATLAALVAAEQTGVKRFVFASSSSVYGDTPTLPKHEGMPPQPLSPYAAAKLAGEFYAASWAQRGALETVSLRFFNVYGPRQDPDSPYAAVIPIFLRKLSEGKRMTVYGDGGQTRDFTYVADVVEGLIRAASAAGVSGRVYNLAGGRPVSVLDMGRSLARLSGKAAEFEFLPSRAGDIRDSFADVDAARRDLGFTATIPLEEGLRRTLGWFTS
ncbi:MAG TPA: NAD-dependent epimerase/dehydratase family protein [Planctomycetota bacterium]|nr:NAD-dependent epimerase/dehydratase family protein [Planctomycetota bacterium]